MSDTALNQIFHIGTNAARIAFTPSPGVASQLYFWYTSDTTTLYLWDGSAWQSAGGGSGITQLTGNVTAGPGSGSVAATIANAAVTLAKIANAAASSKLLGSGASGSGSSYAELTLGTNLSMSGTTLNATGGSGATIHTSAFASPPGSPASGDLWLPSDSYYFLRYSGSLWVPWGPAFPLTDPTISAPSTWVNQGTATVSSTKGGITLTMPTDAADSHRLRVKTAPATPYTITAAILFQGVRNAGITVSLVFRESGSGKIVLFGMSGSAVGAFAVNNYNSPTSYSSSPKTGLWIDCQLMWLQISDDGANRIHRISADGQNWTDVYSVARTTFLTADQVGWEICPFSSTIGMSATMISWKET